MKTKPVGRPPSFDRDKALEGAMRVFRKHGYEGATLEDLLAAMGGINPPSFYNAFGSKEALFKEAVDRYVETVGMPTLQALNSAATARGGVEAMLRFTAESLSMPGEPQGCLVVTGASNCAPANKGASDYVQAIRRRAPEAVRQRIALAIADGEIPRTADVQAIVAFYTTVSNGLAVRAGDGASRKELMSVVDGALAAWEALTQSKNSNSARTAGGSSRKRQRRQK